MAKRLIEIKPLEGKVVTDYETGVITGAIVQKTYSNLDEFIMCFLKTIPELAKLDGNCIRVMMFCWKFSTFNPSTNEPNYITNSKKFKQDIRDTGVDLSDSVIDRCMCMLAKHGFLGKECKGVYSLNPEYFFRGKLDSRSKLKTVLEYKPN